MVELRYSERTLSILYVATGQRLPGTSCVELMRRALAPLLLATLARPCGCGPARASARAA